MKIAVVGSGGGAKGDFEAGVNETLMNMGVRPKIWFGTSTGALNAAGCAWLGPAGNVKVWENIRGIKDIFKLNLWKLLFLGRSDGLYSWKPLDKLIRKVLVSEEPLYDACVTKVSLNNGALHHVYASKVPKEEFLKSLIASTTVPFHTDPVKDGKTWWVDGGVREMTPLKEAIKWGADRIYVILANPWAENPSSVEDPEEWSSHFRFARAGLRAVDILAHEVFVNDIQKCTSYNKRSDKKKIELVVYAPSKVLHGSDDFRPESIKLGLDAGRNAMPVFTEGV